MRFLNMGLCVKLATHASHYNELHVGKVFMHGIDLNVVV